MPATPDPLDCLTALVGLSRSGSPCFPLPTPADGATLDWVTASGSGYYLDALPGLRLGTLTGNGAPDVYERMHEARALAVLHLRSALRMGADYVARYSQRGVLGNTGNGTLAAPGPLTLTTHYHEGGALRITSVRLNTTGLADDVPLLLDGVEVARLELTNNAPQLVSILIPLDGQPHTLAAVLPEGVRALENKLHCPPCSGSSPWGKAVARNLSGITSATSGRGFVLQVSEACAADTPDLLCHALNGDDPAAQARRNDVGQALAYLAGSLFVLGLTVGANANRYTMLEPKMLPDLGEYFAQEAQKSIKWLNGPEGLTRVAHPCYTCAPSGWHPSITNQLR